MAVITMTMLPNIVGGADHTMVVQVGSLKEAE